MKDLSGSGLWAALKARLGQGGLYFWGWSSGGAEAERDGGAWAWGHIGNEGPPRAMVSDGHVSLTKLMGRHVGSHPGLGVWCQQHLGLSMPLAPSMPG